MQNYSTGGVKGADPSILIGKKLGKYEVKDIIGRGGMGVVYKVWDTLEDSFKAIKMVPPDMMFDKLSMVSLKKEVNAAIKLSHPNILKVLGLEEQEGVYFISMEYIEGETLADKLAEKGKLEEAEVIEIMKQVLEGLKEAHRRRVLHLDIKPQNIMITKEGEVKILDFSISYNITRTMTMLTGHNLTTGTLPYMAPEQVSKKYGRVNEQTDIWGFGAMVYHLLSGEVPFETESQIKDSDEKPYPLEGVSEKIKKIVMKCLEKDREKRYKSFEEIIDDLEGKIKVKEKEKNDIAIRENSKKKEKKENREKEEIKKNIETQKDKELPKEVKRIRDKAKSVYKNEQGIWEAEFEYWIKMVYVEGGEFLMGALDDDKEANDWEKPQHKVWVDSFWIGKYPVTFEQYEMYCEKVEKKKPRDEGWGRGNRPVINVSWHDAVGFIEWLYEEIGLRFRLLTEAEWEYACRGGKQSREYKYSGSNIVDEVGWYEDNSRFKTHPVGLKTPNELGIYDMSGNVWEWCSDWYGSKYYSESPYNNPSGPPSGSSRIRRGGSCCDFARDLHCANRGYDDPSVRLYNLGFRLAMDAVK